MLECLRCSQSIPVPQWYPRAGAIAGTVTLAGDTCYHSPHPRPHPCPGCGTFSDRGSWGLRGAELRHGPWSALSRRDGKVLWINDCSPFLFTPELRHKSQLKAWNNLVNFFILLHLCVCVRDAEPQPEAIGWRAG